MNRRKLIGLRIKEARLEQNMTQSELAKKLNYEKSNISYIENGKYSIAAEKLIDFSKALNKKIIYFLSDIE